MICFDEPNLDDLMSDPLIQTLMTADGIEPRQAETLYSAIAQKLEPRRDRRPQAGYRGCA